MKLKNYMKKQWLLYVIIFIAMMISIGLDMMSPQLTRQMIDKVIAGGQMELLPRLLLGFLGIGIGRAIFQYIKEFTADVTGARIGKEMRKDLFDHIETLSMRFFSKNNTGELMARVKDDTERIWSVTGFVGMLAVECVVHTVMVITCMVQLSWKLTIIPLVIMPVVGVIAVKMENKLGAVYEDVSEANARLNTIAQENLAGVRTVKAFAREDYEVDKFKKQNQTYYALNMRQAKELAKHQPLITLATKILLFLIILVGGIMVIQREMSLGELGAFTEYANNIIWPMEAVGWLGNDIAAAFASKKKIARIMEEEPEIKDAPGAVALEKPEGNLEFSHVSLSFDGREVLHDVSFKLEKGKTLGIMGITGAGKTSVVNLIERFYDADKGNILLDGHDIKTLSLKTLRGSVAPVLQDVFLFSDTIDENIRIGSRDTMERGNVEDAAELAMAGSFIQRLSEGYDTVIGERGVGLSGGQKQRISIARALAKQAPILILDDATSALDMETENAIQKNLNQWKHTSKLIIGHRISSVCHADEILILDNGAVAERGTHEELMAKKGFYYDTYVAQYERPQETVMEA